MATDDNYRDIFLIEKQAKPDIDKVEKYERRYYHESFCESDNCFKRPSGG